MAKLCHGGAVSKFGAFSPPKLSAPGAEQRQRYREGSRTPKSDQTRLPLEYYGEKLDNPGLKALIQGQFFDLKRDLVVRAYEIVSLLDTVDIGPYQLELVAPDFTDNNSGTLGKIAVYLRSHNLGEIRLTQKRATFRTNKNEPPTLLLVNEFIGEFKAFIASYWVSGSEDELKPPAGEVCIGVEGERALVTLDKLNIKLSEGRIANLQWIAGKAIVGPFTLEMQERGGIGYRRKAVVRFEGRLYGMVLWDASFKGLDLTARLEIDLAEIYRSYDSGLKESIQNFASLMTSEVLGVFRVDIAIDGPGVMTFLERVHSREIMLVRQSNYHKAKKIVGLSTDEIEGFGCGSRQSGLYFRCYNKTKEIADGRKTKGLGYKEYIDGQFWYLNNLQTQDANGRLEAEILNRKLKTVDGFNWLDLFDRSNLVGLFSTLTNNVFEWVPTEHSDSKINRRPRVEFLDFSEVDTEPYARCYPVPAKSDRMDKITAKKLFVDAAFAPDASTSNTKLNAAADIIEDKDLHVWFSGKVDAVLQTVGETMVELNTLPRPDWQPRFTELANYSRAIAKAEANKPKLTLLTLYRNAIHDPEAWEDITGTAAEGFPFPTTVPATCDARSTDVANRDNFAGVEGKQSGLPLPLNPDLLNTEPGNKKGVLDGMPDGPDVPQNIAA